MAAAGLPAAVLRTARLRPARRFADAEQEYPAGRIDKAAYDTRIATLQELEEKRVTGVDYERLRALPGCAEAVGLANCVPREWHGLAQIDGNYGRVSIGLRP